MFLKGFYKVACALLLTTQSRNNNKWPNKKNDVITDLGGEGDFPMFRYGSRVTGLTAVFSLRHPALLTANNPRQPHCD